MPAIPKVSFDETLEKRILPFLCMGCGSCVVVCPFDCLVYANGKPVLVKECKSCGICAHACPKYNFSIPILERFVFGRERKEIEVFGIFRHIIVARTTDENIMKVCQDGGIVTTLLVYALENEIIDGAVLSSANHQELLKAFPKLATYKDDFIGCAGTRYTYSPNILAFKEGIIKKKRRLAFVGTPCQINAIRKLQAIPLRKYSEGIALTIGLFCSECFTYDGLVKNLIQEKMGISPHEVSKVNIKGKLIVTTRSGEERAVSLKEVKEYVCNCVYSCSDFSAELADISTGGLGLNNWTLTILRTEKGEDLFHKAKLEGLIKTKPIEEEKRTLSLLTRMSIRKREEATELKH